MSGRVDRDEHEKGGVMVADILYSFDIDQMMDASTGASASDNEGAATELDVATLEADILK